MNKNLFLFLFLFSGCTQITTLGDKQNIKYILGVPIIEFKNGERNQYVKIKSYGLGLSNKHISIGYSKFIKLSINDPSECSLFLFAKSYQDFESINRSIAASGTDISQICVYLDE